MKPSVFAAGFHGSISSNRTPSMHQAVYVDNAERLCEVDNQGAILDVGSPIDDETFDTRLKCRIPFRPGHSFLILGDDERSHSRDLIKYTVEAQDEGARAALTAIHSELLESERVCEHEKMVALYCSVATARWMLERIRRVAVRRLEHELAKGKPVEATAWWLQRCATNELQLLTAAAALRHANANGLGVLRASPLFRKYSDDELLSKMKLMLRSLRHPSTYRNETAFADRRVGFVTPESGYERQPPREVELVTRASEQEWQPPRDLQNRINIGRVAL